MLGCCVGNQTGLQKTGKNRPGSDCELFDGGKQQYPAALGQGRLHLVVPDLADHKPLGRLDVHLRRIDPDFPLVRDRRALERKADRELARRRRFGQRGFDLSPAA